MRFGTSPSVDADVSLDTTLLEEFAHNVTLKLKSTTKRSSVVTALTGTKKYQDKDAMESAHLSATSTKIGFPEDVSANLDSS